MKAMALVGAAVLACSCEQLVVCNPRTWCEGDTLVTCDLVCKGGNQHPKSTDPPDSCERKLTRTDCGSSARQCSSFLGGAPACNEALTACTPGSMYPRCVSASGYETCSQFSGPNGSGTYVVAGSCPDAGQCRVTSGAVRCGP